MKGRFASSSLETVRQASDIVRLISDHVPLKPAGARLKGLCPFHEEKTPSFSVDPTRQLFYCFGCGTGGDIFSFVKLYEKVDFPEALRLVAQRFGVALPEQAARRDDGLERLLEINRKAAAFYRSRLGQATGGARARAYLEKRGIAPATAERLGLGYAPDAWETLRRHLNSARFSDEELLRAGLVVPGKSGRRPYDRFRDRLIFPIRDVNGRVVAFGGRALGEAEPKYINSPESPTYTKGSQLYGLDLAREAIRRRGCAVIVEGYLDLAALLQAGFDHVVASLGTAFTPVQAALLGRYTNRVLFSFDGDAAGAAAATRSLDQLLLRGLEVRVVELPSGQDPDDFLRQESAEAYARRLEEAPEYLEFLVRREAHGRDLHRVEEKIQAVNALLPHVAKLESSIERVSWASRMADALRIDDDLVMQELRSVLKERRTSVRRRPERPREPLEAEARLVSLLLRAEENRLLCLDEVDESYLEGSGVRKIVETILELTREHRAVDGPHVLEALEGDEDRDLLTRILFRDEPESGPDLEDCLCALKRDRLRRQGRELVQELNRMQGGEAAAADTSAVDRRLDEIQRVARQRDSLS